MKPRSFSFVADVPSRAAAGMSPIKLGVEDANPACLRLALDFLEHRVYRRASVIGQVHRDLRDASMFQRQPERLHSRKAAAGLTDGRRDRARSRDIRRIEMNVEGDERHPGADDGGAGGRVGRRLAEVRQPVRLGQLLGEPFELVPTNLLEPPPFRSCGRLFVQKDRHSKPFRNSGSELAGQVDAFRHRRLAERHERERRRRRRCGDGRRGASAGRCA